MKLYCQKRSFIYFLILILTLNYAISISSDQEEDKADSNVEQRFLDHVDKVVNGGRLKKIWDKFLKKGISEDVDNVDEASFLKTNSDSQLLATMSTIGIKITKEIMKNSTDDRLIKTETQAPTKLCPFLQNKKCDPNDIFRSIDGSCNNLEFPLLGKANTPYKRFLPRAYDDNLETSRSKGKSGKDLPSPRVISLKLFKENFQFDNDHTHIIAFFGQFITHDFTMASVSVDSLGIPLNCDCGSFNLNCLPMTMPSNEHIMKLTCMKFTRSSSTFSTFDCKLGQREQLNMLTSYLDASQIYGVSTFKTKELRLFQNGLLKTSDGFNKKDNLPKHKDGACQDQTEKMQCFNAGDTRVNNNLALAGIHTLFMREHNMVAIQLGSINPEWDDERLFNEARRIIIAQYQHIVFTEYLPAIIGKNFVRAFDLVQKNAGEYYSGYNPNINPSVANEFSSAAFRFGHSLVRHQLGRYNRHNLVMAPSVNISEIVFRPVEAYNEKSGGIDSLFLSSINEPPSKFDTNIAENLQNHLFEVKLSETSVVADDLAAFNINRGRDHGIPSYNSFRVKCGFPKAETFDDLKDLIDPEIIKKLADTYEHVDDIDYYVGGLSERQVTGALIGPTFSCIIALQFRDFKKGDRFFYENGPSPTAFTIEQLDEIRRTSLARIICNNLDLNFIQPNVFYQPRAFAENSRISCFNLRKLDLRKWKEKE